MMRVFRWRYFVPRLLLTGLAVLFCVLAINPLIRTAIVDSVQTVTGARVDIPGGVRTSVRDSQIQLLGLAVADPHHPMKNLFEADQVDLELDKDVLLKRQIIVRRGRLAGLKLGTDRSTSGTLHPKRAADYQARLSKHFHRLGHEWLTTAAEQMLAGLNTDIESVQVAKQLLQQWPATYAEIETRATTLRGRVTGLRELLVTAGENPLRNLGSYQQAVAELDGLGRDIFEVRRQVDRIRQQIKMDRETISAARQRDLQLLGQTMQLDAMNADNLSEYLLGPEIATRVEQVLQWVRWSRRFAPALTARKGPLGRGANVVFTGLRPQPTIHIDTLVLQGQCDFGSDIVNLEGTVRGLSSDPRMLGKPTEVVIQTTGTTPMLVQATFDATGERPRDRVVIDCPRLPHEPRLLGNTEQLSVAVSPGNVHFWVNLSIEDESLAGEILIKQAGVSLTPQLSPELEVAELSTAVSSALHDVNSLDVAVELSGTLTTPDWQLRSNVGPQLAEGLRNSIHGHMLAKHEQDLLDAHAIVDAQVRELEEQLLTKQQTILESLQYGSVEIERVRSDIATRVEEYTDGVIDPDSPLREVFRR